MSDILAINCDGVTSPYIKINLESPSDSTHSLGWGLGWYPHDHQAAIVTKDPIARDQQILLEAITDWRSFRSTTFLFKIRGAARGYTYHEVQPFSRSFAGRDWLFVHNGELNKEELSQLNRATSRFLEPLGKTDSELAFCYMLSRIHERGWRRIADIDRYTLEEWFQRLDQIGCANIYMTDGSSLVCFQGTQTNESQQLYYGRFQPPNNDYEFTSETAVLRIDDPRDCYRTSLIFSSCQFTDGNWIPMQPGQLIVARRGSVVWSNRDCNMVQIPVIPQPKPDENDLAFGQTISVGIQTLPKIDNFETTPDQATYNTDNQGNTIRSIIKIKDGKPLSHRIYDIIHKTEYNYENPIEHSTHVFRLHPVEDQIQEVQQATLTISVEGEQIQFEDVFGNQSIYYSIHDPYKNLIIESRMRLKIFQQPPDDHTLSRRQSTIPLVWMPWQRQMMMPYLLPFELPETQLFELTQYAMSFAERNDFNLLATLNDINCTIYRDYNYVQGATLLNTTSFEVYTSRRGVCQDFANLFICLARLLDVPARYRVGYIYTGTNYENTIQSEASHAWAEVYLPYIGWRGFDPTNGCMVSKDHIRIACGRNYVDATPTSGTIFKGGGREMLSVDVKVESIHET